MIEMKSSEQVIAHLEQLLGWCDVNSQQLAAAHISSAIDVIRNQPRTDGRGTLAN